MPQHSRKSSLFGIWQEGKALKRSSNNYGKVLKTELRAVADRDPG
jgi:hypothetical protein